MPYRNIQSWENTTTKEPGKDFKCGYCGKEVTGSKAYNANIITTSGTGSSGYFIYICPRCIKPTFFDENDKQHPGIQHGSSVDGVPPVIAEIYEESRRAFSVNSYTLCVMGCRKVVMNLAIDKDAETNKTFAFYIDWLEDNNYINPTIKPWVEKIKDAGNDANHEQESTSVNEAEQILDFVEMLLKLVYEYPKKLQS